MKKLILTILFIFILFSNTYAYNIQTVDDLALWLSSEFTYQAEKGDHWKYPSETIADKGGDCEDFAILVQDVLRELGIKSHIFIIIHNNRKNAHAMTMFKDRNGYIHYFSNNKYYKTRHKELSKVLYDFYGDSWNYIRTCHKSKLCGKRYYKGK
jgi:transglutaminase-like putative cysteine protease